MASIYKKKDKHGKPVFYLNYYYKKKRYRKKIGYSKKLAILEKGRIENLIERGQLGFDIERILFMDFFIKKRNQHLIKVSKTYAKKLVFHYIHFERFLKKNKIEYLQDFKKEHMEEYIAERLGDGRSPKTVNEEIRLIKNIFISATDNGYLKENPIKKIKKLIYKPRPPRYFSMIEIKIIMEKSPIVKRNIYEFLLNTGCRLGEVGNLEWRDLDFKMKQIKIVSDGKRQTKNREERIIPMNEKLYHLLTEMKSELRNPNSRIFNLDTDSKRRHFTENLKIFLNQHDLEKAGAHTFRHTFASILVKRGVSLYKVSKLLGHSDIQMSQKYSHLASKDLKEDVEKIDY
jgi:site-specific recombinase XerD